MRGQGQGLEPTLAVGSRTQAREHLAVKLLARVHPIHRSSQGLAGLAHIVHHCFQELVWKAHHSLLGLGGKVPAMAAQVAERTVHDTVQRCTAEGTRLEVVRAGNAGRSESWDPIEVDTPSEAAQQDTLVPGDHGLAHAAQARLADH